MMRVARIRDDVHETYGLVQDGRVATAEDISRRTGVPLPLSIKSFLFEGWADEISADEISYRSAISDFEILAPIPTPPKIVCLAFNYGDHAAEQDVLSPPDPVIVIKPRTALAGAHSAIRHPAFVKKLDYEIELALVIGRNCKNVPADEAMGCVAGYMILNDVTARDIQFKDGQFGRSKGMDTFAPCGPWITTADEIADPHNLRLVTRINGVVRQDSTTANMSIRIPGIISGLSRAMTLERGDIISTGTPAGVAHNSDWDYLKGGDTVEMQIQGLGSISNTVEMI